MRLRLLLLLPLCGVPAWYAGRSMGARGKEVHSSGHVIVVKGTTDTTPAALREETWDALREMAPTAENRWRALALFERWVVDDPRAAAKRLAALPDEGCRLWPKHGALEAFFKVWAARDMDAAWEATGSDPFKGVRDTVAALRAESRPADVALDESLSWEVRHFAKLKLAAADPATAVRLGLFDGSAIEAALLGAPDPVARWRELKQLGQTGWDMRRAIARLAVNSREAAVVIARDVFENVSPEDYSATVIVWHLAQTAADPEELKAAPLPEKVQQYEWPHAMQSWDERVLRGILDQPPGAGEEQKPDRLIFAHAASELLARDPAALLPYLHRWEQDGTPPDILKPLRAQESSPEYAARVRALIEAAPLQWHQRLTVATQSALEEFEPAFLISRIEQQSSAAEADDSANAISAQGILTRWLQQDTPAAAAWLQDHPSAMDDGALESMAGTWVGRDPESASAWINSLPIGSRKDAAIRGLVQTMTTHDPASASAWAARLSTDAERARVQQDIMAQWHIWEPEAQPAP